LVEQSPKYPLLEAAIRRSRLPRSWTIAAVAGVLLLLVVLAASLDGELASLLEWNAVGLFFLNILGLIYILVVYPFMLRSREQAILAFKPLLSLDDDDFNKVAENISKPSRRWEWMAIFLGISVLGGGILQPWNLDWASGYFWLIVYFVIASIIVTGLAGWLIYDTLVGVVRISRLSRRDLKLDILNTEMMAPVASWSLGISLVFVGLIIFGVIFDVTQTAKIVLDATSIIGYLFMICITLLIFFLSMWTAHRALSETKKSKLSTIVRHMSAISSEMDECMVGDQFSGTEKLSSNITALATYEKRVKEAPTWPFNAAIIRRLFISILTPGLVYLVKILSQTGIRFGS
jgi:hypothetical protein